MIAYISIDLYKIENISDGSVNFFLIVSKSELLNDNTNPQTVIERLATEFCQKLP